MQPPPPIRTDSSNDFANHTMRVRVPATINAIIERNPDYPDTIKQGLATLREQIANDDPIPMLEKLAPDYDLWLPQWQQHEGDTWQNTIWFFAETYFYRQIIEITRWWETDCDPFHPNKQEEFHSDALWEMMEIAVQETDTLEERYIHTLGRVLRGNRIDLSYAESQQFGTEESDDDLLIDERTQAIEALHTGEGAVHIIVDNAGTELAMDLMLADLLLADGIDVVIHLKMHPTFVSDATPADVRNFIALLSTRGDVFAQMKTRLTDAINTGRLRLMPHLFWNSSYFFWQMPDVLRDVFSSARMTIVKGDANYRRLLGDAVWSPETPFSDVMGYFPTPLMALRTLKSDPIVGLQPGEAAKLDTIDSRWRYNGKRGVIHFYKPQVQT